MNDDRTEDNIEYEVFTGESEEYPAQFSGGGNTESEFTDPYSEYHLVTFPSTIRRLMRENRLHLVSNLYFCFTDRDDFREACRILSTKFISFSVTQEADNFYELVVYPDFNRIYEEVYTIFNNLISVNDTKSDNWGYDCDMRPRYYSCKVEN